MNQTCEMCDGIGFSINTKKCQICEEQNTTCYLCENRSIFEDCNECFSSGLKKIDLKKKFLIKNVK